MSRNRIRLLSRPRLLASLAATVGVTTVAACGSNQPVKLAATASPSAVKSPTAAPTATPPPPTPKPTIVAGATYTSPALIQVENLNAARPQSGLSSADVVYEYSAEGGISRFTAIYYSTPKGQVGPVRSARLISPVLIRQYGGVLIYSGSSGYVFSRMGTWGTPRFEETSAGKDMFRIGSRSAPHNLYTDGGRVDDLVRRGARPAVPYSLWARAAAAAPGGTPVSSITVPVSPSERPVWTWNAAAGGWQRSEPDTGVFIDANTGKPQVAPTVIVMQVPANLNKDDIEDGCCTPGWEYFLTGSGAAQFFVNGTGYSGTWTGTEYAPPTFSLAGGAPAPIAAGAVWIEVVPTGNAAATH